MERIAAMLKNKKGMALVISLFFLTVLSILGAAGITTSILDIKIASNSLSNTEALYIAEAGLAQAEAELINDLDKDPDKSFANSDFHALLGLMSLSPSSTAFYTVFSDVPFAGGTYTVEFKNYSAGAGYDPTTVLVRCTAEGRNLSSVQLESYLYAENISPWNNAVFAGGGGRAPVAGNIDLAGSVHLLGSGLASTKIVFNNRSGKCMNSNTGMDPTLANAIDGGATTDLKGKFRVRNGRVDMRVGTATLGLGTSPFRGIYVTTGRDSSGNGVNDDILGGDNDGADQNIFARKGASSAEAYDLGDVHTAIPLIDTTYMNDNSIDLTGTTDNKGLVAGALILNRNTSEDIYDISQSGTSPSGTGCSIVFDGSTNLLLTVTGIVKVKSLTISNDIKYRTPPGGGTIYVKGATLVNGDVLPAAPGSYPTSNVLGVVGAGDLTLGSTVRQLLLTGAYYSAGTVRSTKKMELAGTIVCQNLKIKRKVPKIWQVPSLDTNLPPGMPGSTPVWVFTEKTWREITYE